MSRTKTSTLSKLAIISMLVFLGLSKFLFIPIGSGAPIALAILVFSLVIWVSIIANRLPKIVKEDSTVRVLASTNPLPPIVSARTVAFALAGSRAGAILFGGYIGIAFSDLEKHNVVAYSNRALNSTISAVLSFLMVIISLWLERKCSPPNPTQD